MALISLPGPDRIVKLLTDTNPSKNKARKLKTFKFSINSFLQILAVFKNKWHIIYTTLTKNIKHEPNTTQ